MDELFISPLKQDKGFSAIARSGNHPRLWENAKEILYGLAFTFKLT